MLDVGAIAREGNESRNSSLYVSALSPRDRCAVKAAVGALIELLGGPQACALDPRLPVNAKSKYSEYGNPSRPEAWPSLTLVMEMERAAQAPLVTQAMARLNATDAPAMAVGSVTDEIAELIAAAAPFIAQSGQKRDRTERELKSLRRFTGALNEAMARVSAATARDLAAIGEGEG